MIDDDLLQDFIQRFYGYGNYQARFWFIGMEEGGGQTLDEIARRIAAWDRRGRQELEDVAEYHHAVGIDHLFGNRPKLQLTWSKLIRIALAAEGRVCDTEAIRQYQATALGRHDSDNCLLELMPLPSRNTGTWLFGDGSALPFLTNREAYLARVAPQRVAHLQASLARSRPRAVIFYGQQYQPYWTQIARLPGWQTSPAGVTYGVRDNVLFVSATHPAARGVTNAYFENVGRLIASYF